MRPLYLVLLLGGCAAMPLNTKIAPQQPVGVSAGLARTLHMTEGCTAVNVGKGFVLTAKHCVNQLSIGAQTSMGTLIMISPDRDFAILSNPAFVNTPMVRMRGCITGEHLYAVGWPQQRVNKKSALTVTDGLCSGAIDPADGTMRITAPIYFGNSGGGAWSDDGELLGLTVKGFLDYPGMNYIVSSNDLKRWLP